MGITTDLIYIILAALLGGLVAHLLRQPLIFGYILAGIIVGPFTGGFTVEHSEDIEKLAEIGVALLLFTIGLEFSIGELKRLARISFVATPLQILICSLGGYILAVLIGIPSKDAVWLGAAISLSSTMVVIKTLSARGMLESSTGRLIVAMLIAQDLAVVPMMLILPQLTQDSIEWSAIAIALLKSASLLGVMLLVGIRVLPRFLSMIASQGSRELFFLATVGVAFGAGAISHAMGLSFALGAFIAGMLLSETDFSHQARADVSGLRDLFALIFFASVGMLFDPGFFVAHLGRIVALTVGVIALKAGVASATVRLLGYKPRTSAAVGLGVAQVGEFAFVIANAGMAAGSLSHESFSLMLAVTLLSMIATPGLFWLGSRAKSLRRPLHVEPPHGEETPPTGLSQHVVICGGGSVGQYVASVLGDLGRPYVVLDWSFKAVTQMRDRGLHVVFGDCSRREMLEAAGVARASLVVVATTTDAALPEMVREIRSVKPDVPTVIRVHEVDEAEPLEELQVLDIVSPQFEVGIEIVRQSLLALNEPETQIFALLGQLRGGRYAIGRRVLERHALDVKTFGAAKLLELLWYEVDSSSELAQRSLEETQVRTRFGVSVVAVMRGELFIPTPKPDFTVEAGDLIAVLGSSAQLRHFRSLNRAA